MEEKQGVRSGPAAPAADGARAAKALDLWLRASSVKDGALTRPNRRGAAKVLDRGLTPTAIRAALARLVKAAGLPEGYASPHGLRSGFITEAARAGLAVQAVMRVTLHRARNQVAAYDHELDLAKNPATRLRGGAAKGETL